MTASAEGLALARMRLHQLASQALPIGGYSHSHGLESAVDAKIVHDEGSLGRWVHDLLEFSVGSFEAPALLDFCDAWSCADAPRVALLNEEFLATRETAELRAATVQMGYSMRRLLGQLPQVPAAIQGPLEALTEPSLPCVWAGAAAGWHLPAADALGAYLWAWAENQVLAAVKAVPLGQSAGQRVLADTVAGIAAILEREHPFRARSNFAPALAILSSQHETQYSRLFRS